MSKLASIWLFSPSPSDRLNYFCRALLCISAAYAVMRCLSVCLSVTFVNYVKMNKHIFKKFSLSGSHTILVFPYRTSRQYSDGDFHNGGLECRWGRHKSRFWANIWLYRVLSTLRLSGVINTVPPDRGKFWHLSLVLSDGVCWWQETTTKCLWQKVSTLRQRQQNSAFNCTQW